MSQSSLRMINVGSLFEQLAQNIENRGSEPELSVKSLPFLNEKMWGISKRKLTVIGARPSNGKSAFAVQLCYDIAQQGKKVVFLSLEMENIECAERIASNALEINNRALLQGQGKKYTKVIRNLGKNLLDKHFIISDCIGRTWEDINSIIEGWSKINTVPDIIVLDYIQNIKGSGTQKEAIDEYIRKFREMAIRFNFAGVLCSQINRVSQESKDKTPMLHQLKGTGFLEEHADVVLLLHWPKLYSADADKNHFEINLAKNKLGGTGFLNMRYYPEYFLFKEIENTPVKQPVEWSKDEPRTHKYDN